MTLAELYQLIDANIPNNFTGLITPAKERQVMKALADFAVSSQGEVESASFVYDPMFAYEADFPVIYDGAWYLSLADDNQGNTPDTHPDEWEPINAQNTVISIYEKDTVYLGKLTIVIRDSALYLLDRTVVGDVPFLSTNFESELNANKWTALSEHYESDGNPAFIEGGYWIYSGEGLKFDTVPTRINFSGRPVFIDSIRIDLADFAGLDNDTLPQFVRPQWSADGTVVPIFGEASSDPQEPSVEEPLTQLAGASLLLNAGDTSIDPGVVQTMVIYAEGELGEASLYISGGAEGSGSADFADEEDPIEGLISINASNIKERFRVHATPLAPIVFSQFDFVSFKIQLKEPMHQGHLLRLFFANGPNVVASNYLTLSIQKNNTNVQIISVPFSAFTFSASSALRIIIQWRCTGDAPETHAGFKLDDWILQKGIEPPVLNNSIALKGHVQGSGRQGENIDTVITEAAISDQEEQTSEIPANAHTLIRLPNGSMKKVKISSLVSPGSGSQISDLKTRKVYWQYAGEETFELPLLENWKYLQLLYANYRSTFAHNGLKLDPEAGTVSVQPGWKFDYAFTIEMLFQIGYEADTIPEEIPPVEPEPEPPATITPTVYHQLNRPNFDDVSTGVVTSKAAQSSARYQELYHFATSVRKDGNFSVIAEGGKKYACFKFPKGTTHYDTGANEWIKAASTLHPNPQEIWMEYDVIPRFTTPGEEPLWSIGGKLPGVVCGNLNGGEPFASGGADLVGKGGSLRLNPNEFLDIGLYVYSHGSGSGGAHYGTDLGTGKFTRLNKEVQNKLTIRTVMNSGSDGNGIIQVWHDGKLVMTVTTMRWRLADTPANSFDFVANNWFSGGSGSKFFHPTDCELLNSSFHIGIGTGERVVYKKEDVITLPWGNIGGIL